jgi:hypothetical protein
MNRILFLFVASLSLFAAEPLRQSAKLTTTNTVDFAPGGTVRVDGSYGCVSVEGWDKPQVEIVVTRLKNDLYTAQERQAKVKKLEAVKVRTDHRSAAELTILTELPKGNWFSRRVRPDLRLGVQMEYQIRVPRNTHVVIRHGNGEVFIADVTGEIEARSSSGDIVVMLPHPGQYAIDARTKLGTIYSDFGEPKHAHLVGERSAIAQPAPARRVFLRTGVGGISIQETTSGGY